MEKGKSKKKVVIVTQQQFTIDELANMVSVLVEHDDAAYFIALLDSYYESMEVTEQLINHFDALKHKILDSTVDGEVIEDIIELNPKLLI